MPILTEDLNRTAGYIVSEAHGFRSREQVFIKAASGVLKAGAVLSPEVVPASVAATAAADAANTANSGTIAMDATTPIAATAKSGRYVGVASAATKVSWEDPQGKAIGVSTHGAAFTGGGVKFAITAGASANVVGDKFYVDVVIEPGDAVYAPFDGSKPASAILYEGCDATSAAVRRTITARDSEVQIDLLVWAGGVTSDQKTAALASLATFGIIGR
ncbi:head decoration protein [Rhodopseudomonas sp. HC1]|uniref:head decoration protein n=1 Tax=Rhodopseudomonas infernalis TaxID=2897386 RepID=UPI001EE8D763|nr:head decoration protein [Rhodopseudomonas infernalis]MCG6204192.1 head decoration protein [Rhodopseudomonas infernalis]